jgi:glycosyltransferase involved in cell wall biosynthesis
MELATAALVAELRRAGMTIERVDTADAEDALGNRGRWTPHNITVALQHLLRTARLSLSGDVAVVYLPIAQEFPGLVRDMAFLVAAQVARVPTVIHLHGGSFGDFYGSRSRLVRALLRMTVGRAAVGIVLTESLRPALECILPRERVVVVPNGIDPIDADASTPSAEGLHVLFLSSLFRWKGPLAFIEAFALARRQCPTLRATVAGDWPSEAIRGEATRLAAALGVADALTFPGVVDGEDKRALYASADIFCFASLVPEGQPLVLLEAMAARLPVLAPAWPGIADTVLDGETGLLFPPRASPELWAEALVELARDPDTRVRLGAAGRRRYEALFTQRAFGERMIDVLKPFTERADEHHLQRGQELTAE